MLNRAILLIAGLVLSYALIYMGDGFAAYAWSFHGATDDGSHPLLILPAVLGIVGTFMIGIFILDFLNDSGASIAELFSAVVLGSFFSSFAFGAFGTPFTSFGPWPLEWTSYWDAMPLLSALFFGCYGYEAMTMARAAKPNDTTNVTSIRSTG